MEISSFEDIISISSFLIKKQINKHGFCKFKGLVNSEFKADSIRIGSLIEIKEQGEILFKGVITKCTYHISYMGDEIEIELFTKSVFDDVDKKNQIYQDSKKNVKQVLDCCTKDSGYSVVIKDKDIDGHCIEKCIVQYNLTNFEFVKYIAENYSAGLIINDCCESDGEYIVGNILDERAEKLDISEIYDVLYESTASCDEVKFKIERYIHIGKIIIINSVKYVIDELLVEMKNATYDYAYSAKKLVQKYENCSDKKLEKAIIIPAEVVDNKDPDKKGRIQVKFYDVFYGIDLLEDNRLWLDCISPYVGNMTGVYMTPEIGDYVLVNWVQDKFVVLGSMRTDKVNNVYENIDTKYIGIDGKHYMCFEKDKICITSGETRVEIEDNSLELKHKDNIIKIIDKNIEVTNSKNDKINLSDGITIDSPKNISLKTGKETLINASSNVVVKGSKITLN